jgi:hypothetical protein
MNEPRWPHTARTVGLVGALPFAGTVAYVVASATEWRPTIALVTAAITWFLWAANLILSRHDAVYFWRERIKRTVLNSTSRWSFTVRYRVATSVSLETMLDSAVREILEADGAKLFTRDATSAAMLVASIPLSVHITTSPETHGDDEYGELVFEVPDSQTPYRHLRHSFEEVLTPLLHDLHRFVRPESEKYELTFAFADGANPYFGHFVRRIRPDGDFRWDYMTKTARNGTLRVTRDSLVLVTTNAAELHGYFKKLVGLSLAATQPR